MARKINSDTSRILSKVTFFRSVQDTDPSQFRVLMNISKSMLLERNEILVQEGANPKDFYFLVEGKLGVYVYDPDTEKHIQVGLVRPGQIVGDMSIALQQERLATVRVASESAVVLCFRIETFTNRQRYPEVKDDIHFLFWRDLIQSLKLRVDMFENKYGESPRIEAMAARARTIRREVPSLHSFSFNRKATLNQIEQQAAEIANILEQCNRLVAGHRATGVQG